ncbi:MAG TPA: 50S ribosomal protein L25 [Polyangiaceae bacterium]|jgi:large subunit ribosomal protein L25|nr:50S ribosomal protein L25 [Polyangiaceae bacterium]
MEPIQVQATRRPQLGKAEMRRMRSGTQIPAIAYGKGLAAMPLTLAPADVVKVLKSEYGQNAVIELTVDGKEKITSLLRECQLHPISRRVLHADFVKIDADQLLDIEVPLELTGKSKGVTEGGVLELVYRRVPVRCLPADIPLKLTYDMTEIDIGDSVPAKDLALPKGVTLRIPEERTVAGVIGKEAEEEEVPAAGAAAAPGAPGAPAAAGAAAAPGAAGAAGAAAPAAGAAAKKPEAKKEGKK